MGAVLYNWWVRDKWGAVLYNWCVRDKWELYSITGALGINGSCTL